jgi:hypothetical protein
MSYVWDPNETNLVEPPAPLTEDGYAFESVPLSENVNFLWHVSTVGGGNTLPVGTLLTGAFPNVTYYQPASLLVGFISAVIPGTIGSASSGSSLRAADDMQPLYEAFWNNFPDSTAPVTGGRGATAAADFIANKPISTPLIQNRAIGAAGPSETIGTLTGLDFAPIPIEALPNHTHATTPHSHTDAGHFHFVPPFGEVNFLSGISDRDPPFYGISGIDNTGPGFTAPLTGNDGETVNGFADIQNANVVVQSTGNGDPFDVRQATAYLNMFWKA